MNKLAVLGGTPVREHPVPWAHNFGQEETAAVLSVMESGLISAYIGRAGDGFLGGPRVVQFEQALAAKFNTAYAVAVNSATTALHTAIAACEIGPGDEVLVTPFTMSATASAVLMNHAIPVFVDICEHTYNLDANQIERWITPRTKAIMVTNLFGLPASLPEILSLARKHGLYVIEDNAQSPGASVQGKPAGTFADMGVFSFNYHKIIHSGEGGMILTNHERLAERCRLIRNHGEAVVDDWDDNDTTVLGSNYRMTELHAAIGIEQLKKLDPLLQERRALGQQLTNGLLQFDGLKGAVIPTGYEHSFYVYPIQFQQDLWGISRRMFALAMRAEGFPLGEGYQKPLYLLPLYQHKRVFNNTQFPFAFVKNPVQRYERGICPVAEKMYFDTLVTADVCRTPYTDWEINEFLTALQKVWDQRGRLRAYEADILSRS